MSVLCVKFSEDFKSKHPDETKNLKVGDCLIEEDLKQLSDATLADLLIDQTKSNFSNHTIDVWNKMLQWDKDRSQNICNILFNKDAAVAQSAACVVSKPGKTITLSFNPMVDIDYFDAKTNQDIFQLLSFSLQALSILDVSGIANTVFKPVATKLNLTQTNIPVVVIDRNHFRSFLDEAGMGKSYDVYTKKMSNDAITIVLGAGDNQMVMVVIFFDAIIPRGQFIIMADKVVSHFLAILSHELFGHLAKNLEQDPSYFLSANYFQDEVEANQTTIKIIPKIKELLKDKPTLMPELDKRLATEKEFLESNQRSLGR